MQRAAKRKNRMKLTSIIVLVGLVGCAGSATSPQNGCGTRYRSWCVSKFVSTRTVPSLSQDEERVAIDLNGRDAVLAFPKICTTGEFRNFSPLSTASNVRNPKNQGEDYGWSSVDNKCSIRLIRGNMSASEYSDLARNVHYYLIEIGPKGVFKTFSF